MRTLLVCLSLAPLLSTLQAQSTGHSGRTRLASDTSADRRSLLSRHDALVIGGVLAATAATMLVDGSVAHSIQRDDQPMLDRAVRVDDKLVILRNPGALVASGALYLAGRAAGQHDLADVGLHSVTAVILAGGATKALKGIIGRGSPSQTHFDDPRDFSPGKGFGEFAYQSMPSGHTALAFTLAAVVSSESRRVWPSAARFVAPAMYTGATIVGASWLAGNRHWASDIVLGAGVGLFSGWKVVRFAHAHPDNVVDRVLLGLDVVPSPHGAAFAVRLAAP